MRRLIVALVLPILVGIPTSAHAAGIPPEPASGRPAGQESVVRTQPRSSIPLGTPVPFGGFDDFQRVVADGWGTAPNGVVWSDDTLREEGQTSAQLGNHAFVDGNSGRVDVGTHGGMWQGAHSGPWQMPAWSMTGSFIVTTVPTNNRLDLYYWIFKDSPEAYADIQYLKIEIGSGPGIGSVSVEGSIGDGRVSVPKTDWVPNSVYRFRWTVVWGQIAYASVWRAGDSEPGTPMVIRDATHDQFRTGDNTTLEIATYGNSSQPASVIYDDLAVTDLPSQTCGSETFPNLFGLPEEVGTAGDRVHVKYDTRFLVDPRLPNAKEAARQIALAIQTRAQDSIAKYMALGPATFADQIVLELTCRAGPLGLIDIAPGQTDSDRTIRINSDQVHANFAPAVTAWLQNPGVSIQPPHDWWQTTVDHELFHTMQFRAGGANPTTYAKLLGDPAYTEGGATVAQDLFPDWDDEPHVAGTFGRYDDAQKAFFAAPVTLRSPYSGNTPYETAPILEYFGERFGPANEPDLEKRIATFLDALNRADSSGLSRLAKTLGYDYGTGIFGASPIDPIAALRDFYVAAYAASGIAGGGFAEYQIKDDLTSTTGTSLAPHYGVLGSAGLTQGGIGGPTMNVQLDRATGHVHEITLVGAEWVHVAVTSHFFGGRIAIGDASRPRIAIFRITNAGFAQLDDSRDLYVGPSFNQVFQKDYSTAGASKLVVVVTSGDASGSYDLAISGPTAAQLAIVSPGSNTFRTTDPQQPIEMVVRPTLDGQLVHGLGVFDVNFSIDGFSAFKVSQPIEESNDYKITIEPLSPLSAGPHSITATWAGQSSTVSNAISVTALIADAPPLFATTSAQAAGTAGAPIDIAVSLVGIGSGLAPAGPQAPTSGNQDGRILGASVVATVTPPVGTPQTLRLFDDGLHSDGGVGDGIYGTRIWTTTSAGAYGVHLTATHGSDTTTSDVTVPLGPIVDGDGDGVSDIVEGELGMNPADPSDGQLDQDADGIGARDELAAGTSPTSWDTDGGGEADISEVARGGSITDASDDLAHPTVFIAAVRGDGNVISVNVATSDSTGSIDLYRTTAASRVLIGTYPGTGAQVTDTPPAGTTYVYGAVGHFGSVVAAPVWTGPVTPAADVTAPFVSLQASAGHWYGNSLVVPILVASPDADPVEMRLKGDSSDPTTAPWVPFQASTTVTVAASDGGHLISGQARDAAGNISPIVLTWLSIDRVSGTSSLGGLPAAARSRVVTLAITSADAGSGVDHVELWVRARALSTDPWGAWTHRADYASTNPAFDFGSDGYFELYTISVDRAGNREATPAVADASTVIDGIPPTSAAGPLNAQYATAVAAVPYVASDDRSGVDHVELWSRYRSTPTGTWSAWALATTATASPIQYTFASGDGYYEFYTVAVDLSGNRELPPAAADAATQKVPGSAWDASVRVNDDTGGANQLVPDVAIGPDGAAVSVWWDYRATPGYDIYASRRSPTTGAWSANQRVNDVATGDQFYPAVAIDGSNNAYAVWVDTRNGRRDIYFSKRSATTGLWSANVRVNSVTTFADQTTPSIAVASNGAAVAVWYRTVGNNKHYIYSARLSAGATTWGPEIKVSSDTAAQKQGPKVTLGSDGTAYAVWLQPSSGNADVWFATLAPTASAWSANTKISDDPGTAYQGQPDIGVDTAGNVIVAWDDWRASPNQLRIRRRPAGGAWTPSISIAADGANFPSLAVRGDGRAYVAWYDGLNALYPNVWSSSFDPATGAWSTAEQIDVNGVQDGASSPAVAIGANRLVVVWQNATRLPSGGNDVDVFARTRAP